MEACTTDQEKIDDGRTADLKPTPDRAHAISCPGNRPNLFATGRHLEQSALQEDPDATVPLINNKLALRAIAGRQSFCPSKPIEVKLYRLSCECCHM